MDEKNKSAATLIRMSGSVEHSHIFVLIAVTLDHLFDIEKEVLRVSGLCHDDSLSQVIRDGILTSQNCIVQECLVLLVVSVTLPAPPKVFEKFKLFVREVLELWT